MSELRTLTQSRFNPKFKIDFFKNKFLKKMPIIVLNNNLSTIDDIKMPDSKTIPEWDPIGEQNIEQNDDVFVSFSKSEKFVNPEQVEESKMLCYAPTDSLYRGTGNNEFLNAVIHAYNNHLSLRLNPDHILQCVSMAVATCISEHSEDYRDVFVNHSGKKKLQVVLNATTFDPHLLTDMMSELVNENVKSSLNLEPNFSTTTRLSKTIGNLTKMATFKKYFSYGFMLGCGIRSVDLEGTLEDWLMLKTQVTQALNLIKEKGHMVNWSNHMLTVINNLIETYRNDMGEDLENFWSRIITYVPYGSGRQSYTSGWINVFFPGSNYDKFPEKLNLLDSSSNPPPKKNGNYYEWQDEMKNWAQLTDKPPKSYSILQAELNDHGVLSNLYCKSGFMGFTVHETFVSPVLGYSIHSKLV